MLSPFLFDPTKSMPIEEQVEFIDGILGRKHHPRDMSRYLEAEELEKFEENLKRLNSDQKAVDICQSSLELVKRALVLDEGVSRQQAEQLVTIGLGTLKNLVPEFIQKLQMSTTPTEILFESAGRYHCELTKAIFTAALKLNLEDFRSIFPERFCIHDAGAVIEKMKNPDYKLSAEERKRHFARNKDLSFSILNSISTWEVGSMVPMESMQILQNAARYNLLKSVFGEQAQQGPSVQVGDELNSADV